MEQIAAEMVAARPDGLLLVAQSNAGLPQVVGDHFEYDATPDDLAAHAVRLREPRHRPGRAAAAARPRPTSRRWRRRVTAGRWRRERSGVVVGDDGVAALPVGRARRR